MKKNKRILIAENNMAIIEDLQSMLEKVGHTVISTSSTGKETIKKVKELKPDIVVINIYLAGEINGKDIAEKIKEFSDSKIMLYSLDNEVNDFQNIKTVPNKQDFVLNNQIFCINDDI